MKIIKIQDIEIELEKKRIKNMYLKVLPPDGRIRISAPYRMSIDRIQDFVLDRMDWLQKTQERIKSNYSGYISMDIDYLDGDPVFFDGIKYELYLQEGKKTGISLEHSRLIMHVRPQSTPEQRKRILYNWYRNTLYERINILIDKWEPVIGVRAEGFTIRNMKSRWGSCNIRTKRLSFSLMLAQKRLTCVEYVVVHELVHLLEGSHNHVFKAYMDRFLPGWRQIKKELNRAEPGFIEK